MNRDDFLEIVYDELRDDPTNDRANRIIDAFDSVDDEQTIVVDVGVVRCKDCKHYCNDGEAEGICWCDINSQLRSSGEWDMWDEDEYCSRGERKEE